MNEIIEVLTENLSNDYYHYIDNTDIEGRDYILREQTNKENEYSLTVKFPKDSSVLIINNLEKIKSRISVDTSFLVKDCDYIILFPKQKQILCIELKQRQEYKSIKKEKRRSDNAAYKQILCGPFWLHLLYHSFILQTQEQNKIRNLYTSFFNEWKFLGLDIELYKNKNRHYKPHNGLYNLFSLNDVKNFPVYKVEIIGKTVKFLDLFRLKKDIKHN